jgi:sugar-specific transcriptional regulator TrmB
VNSEPDDVLSSNELAQELNDFGLSINQAKVYLSVARLKVASVSDISRETQLYRQDIYKIMPVLSKKGLIAKILDKPIKFEALPIEKAIDNLVSIERKKAEEKLSRLASLSKTLKSEAARWQNDSQITRVEPKFMLLVTDSEIRNMFDLSFENTKGEFNVVTTTELAPRLIGLMHERVRLLAKRKIKTKIIIDNPSRDFEKPKKIVQGVQSTNSKFFLAIKHLSYATFPPYRVFDDKEAWIMISKETETGAPCFLWTNAPNVVKFYKENFEKAWNDPKAEVLYGPHNNQQ